MSDEPVDLAGFEYRGMVYTKPVDNPDSPPLRLLQAMARGEVTEGGLAEAGWRVVGTITSDGIKFKP